MSTGITLLIIIKHSYWSDFISHFRLVSEKLYKYMYRPQNVYLVGSLKCNVTAINNSQPTKKAFIAYLNWFTQNYL